jgi:hypothetical protein
LFRLPSSPDFLSLGSFRLDLRIYRTSALLFYSFRIRHFRIRYIWYINFSGILVESYGTWLLFQRLDDSSKDSDIPKNVPFAFAINNRNTIVQTRVEHDPSGNPTLVTLVVKLVEL